MTQTIEQLRVEWQRNEAQAKLAQAREELAQVRAELAQVHENNEYSSGIFRETNDKLAGALTQACDKLAGTKMEADVWFDKLMQAREELAELRKRASIRVQKCGYCDYQYSTGTNAENFAVMAEHIKSCPSHPLAGALTELAQARDELKDLQGANKALGQQVADVTENRDYWYETALAAEAERDQIRKEAQAGLKLNAKMLAHQCDMARVAETEAMIVKRQLAEAEAKLTRAHWLSPDEAAAVSEWTRRGKEEHGHVQERLATLDTAEAALADCGSRGIYTDFDSPADAIMQMAAHIEELKGEPIEIEITGKEMVEALQAEVRKRREAELAAHVHDKAADELVQTLHTERQLRREAEQRAEGALATARKRATRMGEAERRANKAVNQLSRAGEREHQANQRAERAEALAASAREAAEWLWGFWDGNTLVAKPGYEDDIREAWDRLLAATGGVEAISLLDRLERAEALAALVTEETAGLLERLAVPPGFSCVEQGQGVEQRIAARTLAAQIREALVLEENDES